MGITLKAARVNVGMSRTVAAEKLEVAVSTLRNYEIGKTYPPVDVVKRMENVYGVSYSDLIFLPMYTE
ncbi:MAG: helix-turn-helix transcriptional regulator [Prevotella sp.]|nr:helix-turn-helix transcriptional regulator [Candidatus Prevotella equi]